MLLQEDPNLPPKRQLAFSGRSTPPRAFGRGAGLDLGISGLLWSEREASTRPSIASAEPFR